MNQICALWANKSKAGKQYYKGKFLGIDVLIFPNTTKEKGSSQPDAFLSLGLPQSGDGAQASNSQSNNSSNDDDLPF